MPNLSILATNKHPEVETRKVCASEQGTIRCSFEGEFRSDTRRAGLGGGS